MGILYHVYVGISSEQNLQGVVKKQQKCRTAHKDNDGKDMQGGLFCKKGVFYMAHHLVQSQVNFQNIKSHFTFKQ